MHIILYDVVSFGALEVKSGDMKSGHNFVDYNCDKVSNSLKTCVVFMVCF